MAAPVESILQSGASIGAMKHSYDRSPPLPPTCLSPVASSGFLDRVQNPCGGPRAQCGLGFAGLHSQPGGGPQAHSIHSLAMSCWLGLGVPHSSRTVQPLVPRSDSDFWHMCQASVLVSPGCGLTELSSFRAECHHLSRLLHCAVQCKVILVVMAIP